MTRTTDDGFTLVELLVTTLLLSIVLAAFYQVLFSGMRGSQTSQSVVVISQQARQGLNRMIRDTREAMLILGPTDSEPVTDRVFRIKIDFDGDDSFDNPNSAGDYEIETFRFDPAQGVITLNGETLVTGVEQIPGRGVFSYSSNQLAYDWDGNGVTTAAELDAGPSNGVTDIGNGDGQVNSPELKYLSNVSFALRLTDGGRSTDFFAEAQLRNRR
jgi:prepilin-type N-terminal cleavage/methylation domain-containing protein